ncbi:unnamed protein product [Nippostrongylus brasiliensis]|uniref:Uncharacterized protein n=1 Tax=Nippostrongylus brasiliensis TaxID=27835 RepID=A0A0N4YVJ2_NIPBR|nr:unnamed protein product [Nippostrongylus brasiliensis]
MSRDTMALDGGEVIGNTPLLRLNHITKGLDATIGAFAGNDLQSVLWMWKFLRELEQTRFEEKKVGREEQLLRPLLHEDHIK